MAQKRTAGSRRKPSSTRKNADSSAKTVPIKNGQRILNTIEGMYTMHLLLLVTISVLAGILLVVVVKQQHKINSLEFRQNFLYEKYSSVKDNYGSLLEKNLVDDAGELPEQELGEL